MYIRIISVVNYSIPGYPLQISKPFRDFHKAFEVDISAFFSSAVVNMCPT